jgi:aminoglycoside phosphotransferase (APT) family kinase protein
MREGLLSFLACKPQDGVWREWEIHQIEGSANNLLYRATCHEVDWAVKFTIRDQRRPAWREFYALLALQEAGLNIAPAPVYLDESSYTQPVVVQEWCDGMVTAVPPQTDTEWNHLLTLFASLATVTPDKVSQPISEAMVNFTSVGVGIRAIHTQLELIPTSEHPVALDLLLANLQKLPYPQTWASCPRALCHVDGNTLNFLRRPKGWTVVDWENSGWGDPAFEIVDLMCHPKYVDISMSRWEWVMREYVDMTGDETAVVRMRAYYPLTLVWWAARLARMIYEIPRGKDQRLVQPPPGWQNDLRQKMQGYIERATAVLETVG